MNKILKNIIIVAVLILIAVVSFTRVSGWAADTSTHTHEIEQIDQKIDTVFKLTGGATAASAVISLLPDDQCTPIAQELAELAKYFLVVLSALYLEKYMITITGYAAFSILIPLSCLIWGYGYLSKRENARGMSYKVIICALAIYCIVPLSVKVSDMIYVNYEESIANTVASAEEISTSDDVSDEGLVKQLTTWITEAAETAVNYVTSLLNNFVEALAVMIVTSCIIPVLVIAFIVWIIKLVFGFPATRGEILRIIDKREAGENE